MVSDFVTAVIGAFIWIVFAAETKGLLLFSQCDNKQLMFDVGPSKVHGFLKAPIISIVVIPATVLISDLPN